MTTSTSDPVESAEAVRRFCGLLDPDVINAYQPMGPATVHGHGVVIWLLGDNRE